MDAVPEAQCARGTALDPVRVRRGELPFVAICRGKEEADLLALAQRVVADPVIAEQGATLELGGRVEAHRLVEGLHDQGGVRGQAAALVGVLPQTVQRGRQGLGEGVAGCDQEVDERLGDVIVVEWRRARGLGEQRVRQARAVIGVASRVAHPAGDEGLEVCASARGLLGLSAPVRAAVEEAVDPRPEARSLRFGQSGEPAGDARGQGPREVARGVEAPAGQKRIEEFPRDRSRAGLEGARCRRPETRTHQAPDLGVARRVHLARHAGVGGMAEQQVRGRDAARHRECRALGGLPDVLEAGQEPGVVFLEVEDRRLGAQARVEGLRVLQGLVAVGIVEAHAR